MYSSFLFVLSNYRGGPVPREKPQSMHKDWQPLGYVSNWGGMEVGSGMMYPVSVVDGLVHQLGGLPLKMECAMKSIIKTRINAHGIEEEEKCPVGQAVVTSAGGYMSKLGNEYDEIIHTAPPFYKYYSDDNESGTTAMQALQECYKSSFCKVDEIITGAAGSSIGTKKSLIAACPLLGAGARGFPTESAIEAAAEESFLWLTNDATTCDLNLDKSGSGNHPRACVAFGIPDNTTAESLITAIEQKF